MWNSCGCLRFRELKIKIRSYLFLQALWLLTPCLKAAVLLGRHEREWIHFWKCDTVFSLTNPHMALITSKKFWRQSMPNCHSQVSSWTDAGQCKGFRKASQNKQIVEDNLHYERSYKCEILQHVHVNLENACLCAWNCIWNLRIFIIWICHHNFKTLSWFPYCTHFCVIETASSQRHLQSWIYTELFKDSLTFVDHSVNAE